MPPSTADQTSATSAACKRSPFLISTAPSLSLPALPPSPPSSSNPPNHPEQRQRVSSLNQLHQLTCFQSPVNTLGHKPKRVIPSAALLAEGGHARGICFLLDTN